MPVTIPYASPTKSYTSLPSPTHTFSLCFPSHLSSISNFPSTPLLCHPPPQFLSSSSSLPYVPSSLPPTPFLFQTPIFIPSSAPTHFPPTPTLLALSSHIQYIQSINPIPSISTSNSMPVTCLPKLFLLSFPSLSIISLTSRASGVV